MFPTLMVGTANDHKTAEIAAVLEGLTVRFVNAKVLLQIPAVEETGSTFEENATVKAIAFAQAGGGPAGSALASRLGDRSSFESPARGGRRWV